MSEFIMQFGWVAIVIICTAMGSAGITVIWICMIASTGGNDHH